MAGRKLSTLVSLALAGALVAGQAATASAATRFGNTLTNSDGSVKQPTPTRVCDNTGPNEGDPCTMVSVITSNFGHEKAPQTGTIHKVRVVSLHSGSFRLYFAKAHTASQEAKVVYKGPVIHFNGDDSSPYSIEVTNVSIHVQQGWYIAIKASEFKTVSCTSGSPAQLEFQPPLVVGDPYAPADDHNGCHMLVELVY
jgi:hypothetical protein